MAATPEAKVKARVVKQLKDMGAYYFSPVTGGYGRSGVFDIVCCIAGEFVGIECKATSKNAPTKLQSSNAALAKTSGGHVLLINEDNVNILAGIILRIKLAARIKHDKTCGSNQQCVWPFDGVETDSFKP